MKTGLHRSKKYNVFQIGYIKRNPCWKVVKQQNIKDKALKHTERKERSERSPIK